MKTLISALNFSDLCQVLGLASQLGYPSSEHELKVRFTHLSNLPEHGLFKSTNGDQLCGWIHLEKVFDLIEETKVEIKALVVDEKYRGQGHGAALVNHAKNWAHEQGVNTIYLSCNIVRERTHDFYKREGFSHVKTSHFFELQL